MFGQPTLPESRHPGKASPERHEDGYRFGKLSYNWDYSSTPR